MRRLLAVFGHSSALTPADFTPDENPMVGSAFRGRPYSIRSCASAGGGGAITHLIGVVEPALVPGVTPSSVAHTRAIDASVPPVP